MERIREARRSSAVTLNNGMSRRRPRSGGSRDSPDEDGGLEMAETTTTRLRDRVSKRDRDRDRERERLSRGKRRRESMALHGGRDEGDDSSDDSLGEDEDEEEEDDMLMPSRSQNPSTSSVSQGTNHHHNHHLNHGSNNQNHNSHHQQQQKKSLLRLPARWRADEMIGVPVPRKARTACRKRTSNEWFESAQRQASSASPSRMSPASTSQQISPSGSNASIRKKIQKPMSGPKQPRPPPPKVSNSKQSFFIQEEIEVAEVLFGLTRQFKKENQKQEQKESAESKSRASSPQQTLPQPSESNFNSSTLPIIAPKRKKPRNLKEDEAPASVSSTSKAEKSGLEIKVRFESSSPKREKNPEPPAVRNGFQTQAPPALPVKLGHEQELKVDLSAHEPKPSAVSDSDRFNRPETREESFFPQKEAPSGSNSNNREEASKKTDLPSDGTREHNFSIDLMAPPPGKLSPEREGFFNSDADQKAQGPEVEIVSKANTEKKEDEKPTQLDLEHRKSEKTNLEECSTNKKLMGKERGLDLQLDLEKPKNEALSSKSESQQPKVTKVENRQDKAVPPSTLPTPMAVGGWPGNLPPFGFMSQVPALPAGLVPVSGNPGSSTNLQPRSLIPSPIQRPKRCATHCYIAQLISYHQRFAKMNPFWAPGAAAAAATSPAIYGARPFNMGMVPPTEAALLGSQVPGNFPGRNLGAMPEVKGAPPNLAPKFPGNHPEEKATAANSLAAESAQRKQQVVLQQQSQSGPMGNMLPGPAFIFPLNQQQVAAAVAAAANRGGAMPPGASTSSSTTTANAGPTAAMNLSFAGMPPTEAQFLTILQNGAYPFPVPGHTGAPPSYRGAAPGQAMPFFNAPFYPHQMPHPSQLQAPPHQQQSHSAGPQQPPVHTQQTGQKTGVSSSSSSSQKNQPSYIQEMNHLLGAHARQQDSNDKGPDGRGFAQDSKVPASQKAIYGHNFSLPMHPQNFAFMSAAGSSAALSSGNASLSEKPVDHPQQPPPQARNQNARIDIASSQPFAMPPFGTFPGPGAAPVGLDFSSMVPNHHIFQNHPDGARHGYPHMGPAPGAAVPSQHQKPHNPSDSKSASGDSTSKIVVAEEERKNLGAAMKFPSGETQHPLSFSKKENEHPGPSISSSNTSDSSSRTLNLIPAYREGHGSGNRSGNATPALTTASAATVPPNMATPHQQMLIQLQKQHQQQQQQVQHHVMQQQQQLSNSRPKSAAPSANQSAGYSERIPNMTSFPSTLMTFPQALMQGGSGNSPGQSPQWKPGSNARAATPAPPTVQAQSSAAQAATKNNSHHLHPQNRNMQQNLPFSTHQTQISFGSANSLKAASSGPNQPGAPADISRSLAAAMAGASPSPSASKNSASGSPPSISVSKPGAPASTTLTAPQQQSAKNSPSSSSSKAPPPQGHQNAPSILGHPSIGAANNSSMKSHNQSQQQQQQQQHQLKQQHFGQPQLFFTHPYAPQGTPHANPAANYHQKRQPDKTPQQQNPVAGSTVFRMPTQGLLHAAQAAQSAAGGGHPRMPASFYMPVAPVSVSKPTIDQKPASGN